MINSSIKQKQLREFGLMLGFVFPLFIGFLIPAIGGHSFQSWTLWVGIPSLTIGITRPSLLRFPYKFWMGLGYCLGWINSRIILGLIFIVVLQPISLIMRLIGHDPLKKRRGVQPSYRENKENHTTDFTKIF